MCLYQLQFIGQKRIYKTSFKSEAKMQDAFREVLRDVVYRRWLIAKYYRNSLRFQEMLYGDVIPDDFAEVIKESEQLIQYLEEDKLFNPNRNLPIRACTLRACS